MDFNSEYELRKESKHETKRGVKGTIKDCPCCSGGNFCRTNSYSAEIYFQDFKELKPRVQEKFEKALFHLLPEIDRTKKLKNSLGEEKYEILEKKAENFVLTEYDMKQFTPRMNDIINFSQDPNFLICLLGYINGDSNYRRYLAPIKKGMNNHYFLPKYHRHNDAPYGEGKDATRIELNLIKKNYLK